MWCPQCRQDVPGIASGAAGKLCCVRCRAPVARDGGQASGVASATSTPIAADEPEPRIELDLTAQLEALERLAAWDLEEDPPLGDWPAASDKPRRPTALEQRYGLIDPAHAAIRGWHRQSADSLPPGFSLLRLGRKSLAGWILLTFGLTSFFCGAALLTWSLFGNRPDLWTTGVPITLAGQVGLLLGVVLALDRLGHQNRQTVDRLGRLDEALDELRSAAWLSGPATPTPNHTVAAPESAKRPRA